MRNMTRRRQNRTKIIRPFQAHRKKKFNIPEQNGNRESNTNEKRCVLMFYMLYKSIWHERHNDLFEVL